MDYGNRFSRFHAPLGYASLSCSSLGTKELWNEELLSLIHSPILSTCPLHAKNGCGKERRVINWCMVT